MVASTPEGPDDRLADLQARLDGLQRAMEGHHAWLTDLQKWMTATVTALSGIGLAPSPDGEGAGEGSGGTGPGADALGILAARLDVWACMQWIAQSPMPEGPLVSVTVATRDRPALLRRAIDSVLAQSYRHLELVVADDSDGPETAAVLAAVADDRLTVVRTPARRGPGAAYNAGLDAASGDIIAFLDDDNTMHPEWLRAVVWAFGAHPEADVLYGARVVEDPSAHGGERGGLLPSLDFQRYDAASHRRANYVDRNTMALRAPLRRYRFDESLPAAVDWEHALRVFADHPPLALPALACFYSSAAPGRISDRPDQGEAVRAVRSGVRLHRPLRVHLHEEMYPVLSETYIGEDIATLRWSGATVTVSAQTVGVSKEPDAVPSRLDVDDALREADPDVVLLHWATHATEQLPLLERHGLPFACRAHTFDVQAHLVEGLLAHPLCLAVYAHPHHLALLPEGVQPLIPVVGPGTVLPPSPPPDRRTLVLSTSACLPKKDFPLLVDAFAQLPGLERRILVARTNGVVELPEEVVALAAGRDPGIEVAVDVPRAASLADNARAAVLVYSLQPDQPMGYPMSIIEAMLCGTIVVAPERPESYAIVGDDVRTYRTADDIAAHVRAVLAGGPEIDAARESLRRRAARHRAPMEVRRLHDSLRAAVLARAAAGAG